MQSQHLRDAHCAGAVSNAEEAEAALQQAQQEAAGLRRQVASLQVRGQELPGLKQLWGQGLGITPAG